MGKIAEALPLAYEEYNIYLSNNISFPASLGQFLFGADIVRKRILRGRILAGEPEDLNF